MKKIIIILGLLLIAINSFSQKTYTSKVYLSRILRDGIQIGEDEIKTKDRIIIIGDKLIAITNYIGGTEIQYLVVNEIKEDPNLGKVYVCTTKDKDFINGYQKAIVTKTDKTITLGMFAGNLTYMDIFLIENEVTLK